MTDTDIDTQSNESSMGSGPFSPESLLVQQQSSTQSASPLATCRFINRRNGAVTVSVWYQTGGVSNGTLRFQNDYWDLHVRAGDCYCWDVNGPCNANCSLRCAPGGTYYVG